MAANINDKLRGVRNGGSPQPSTISATRAISGTSLSAVALTNWFSDTPTDFITYKKTAAGAIDRTTLCGWKGIVSGNTINSLVLVFGTDAGNDIGDSIEAAPTDAWAQGIYDWGNTEHNVDGTHKASSIKTAYLADGSVTTDKVADASITAPKIDFTTMTLGKASITSNFSSSSTTDVAITGLSVSVTVKAGQRIKVLFNCWYATLNATGAGVGINIKEDGNIIGGKLVTSPSSGLGLNIDSVAYSDTPTAGSHTYTVTIGSGTVSTKTVYASATTPATLMVEVY